MKSALYSAVLAAFALSLTSCFTQTEAGSCGCIDPVLLDYEFQYDMLDTAGFAPKQPSWNGDTLTVWDYWALSDQPNLEARAEFIEGELHIRYAPLTDVYLSWSPPVETRLMLLIPRSIEEVTLHFQPAPAARPALHEPEIEAGIQDAREERIRKLHRPR